MDDGPAEAAAAAAAAPAAMEATTTTHHPHPYFPRTVELPGFVPPTMAFEIVLAYFFAACGAVMLGVWLYSGRHKHLSTQERLLASWFLCTGLIHLIVEGDVVLFPSFYKDASGNLLHEIWKEYAKADSRYATRDDFTVSMEAVTAFLWGPLCLALVPAIFVRSAWRHAGIALVSGGQIYGDVLYYGTCVHGALGGGAGGQGSGEGAAAEGAAGSAAAANPSSFLRAFGKHSRPEPLYFWFYFVAINAVWIVVPGMCLAYAVRRINAAVAAVERPPAPKKRR